MNDNSQPSTSRRQVLAATAWSVPVVATAIAVPGASASPCTLQYPGAVRFQSTGAGPSNAVNYTQASTSSGSANVALTGAPSQVSNVGVTFATAATGGAYTLNANNLGIITPNGPGGVPGTTPRLALQQTSSASTATPRGFGTTVTFARPVSNLTFTILGFTRSSSTYNDAAYITSSAAFTRSGQGTQVSGAGTSASPWTTNTVNVDSGQTTTANSVTVTFAGPVSSFTINYYSAGGTGGGQAIFLSNMTFNTGC